MKLKPSVTERQRYRMLIKAILNCCKKQKVEACFAVVNHCFILMVLKAKLFEASKEQEEAKASGLFIL